MSRGCANCGSVDHATGDCPHSGFASKCANCGSLEHSTGDCPHGRFSSKCANCGSLEHATGDCPHGRFSSKCANCGSVDHEISDCPHSGLSSKCTSCGSKNHSTADCPHGMFSGRKQDIQGSDSNSIPTSSASNQSIYTALFWLIGIGAVVFIIIWLAVNVVLPIAILNSAILLTILALVFKKYKVLFAILALIGGSYMLLDVVNGWLSLKFVENIVKTPNWITAFVLLNAVALGVSTLLLLQSILGNEKLTGKPDKKKKNLFTGLSIILVTTVILSFPLIYYSIENPFIQKSKNNQKLDSQIISQIQEKPNQQSLVKDIANVFTTDEKVKLEQILIDFYAKTSIQIAVVTLLDLKGINISDYAVQLGYKWRIGGETFDNGILILVKPKTSDSSGKAFIAVGNSLKSFISDTKANQILNKVMIPHFKANDLYGGVESTTTELIRLTQKDSN